MKRALILLMTVGSCFAVVQWTPLFNGTTWAGWYVAGDQTYWTIDPVDSAIVGEDYTRTTPYTMVFTDRDDFDQLTIKYSYRLLAGCSGFFFRAEHRNVTELVAGMQVEAKYSGGEREVGSIYCHNCSPGGWQVQHSQSFDNLVANPEDEYQDVLLTVRNPFIYVNVNGHQAIGETDNNLLNQGYQPAYRYTNTTIVNTPGQLGLQIHGGQRPMDVRFKRISILQACTQGANADQNLPTTVAGTNNKHPAVYEHNASLCTSAAGCTDPAADNPTPGATSDDGSCAYTGCGNAAATNDFCLTNPAAFPCAGSNGYTRADITGENCTVGIRVRRSEQPFGMAGENKSLSVSITETVGEYLFSIFDVTGKSVETKSGRGAGQFQFSLKPGIYFVKYSGEGLHEGVVRVNLF